MGIPSFNYRHYVPILKCKRGELHALRDLDPAKRDMFTPLLEIPFTDPNSRKSPEVQIDATINNMRSALWDGASVFLDCVLMDPSSRYGSIHPMQHIVFAAVDHDIDAVPVLSLSSDAAYVKAVGSCVASHDKGIALRLTDSDFGDSQLQNQIDAVLDELGVSPAQADLIIDFGSVAEDAQQREVLAARALVSTLPHLKAWRTLTLASTTYPKNLSSVGRDRAIEVTRTDFRIWLSLIQAGGLPRLPTFGDYGSDGPGLLAFDPTKMQVGVNLRYSTRDNYIVAKGGSLRKVKGDKYRKLAEWLIRQPFFADSQSWADTFLRNTASGNGGPGNPETWRRVGTNSHLEVVTNQIANLP